MLKFAICDDDVNARNKYKGFLNIIFEKNDINAKVVYDCDNPNTFYTYFSDNPVDVVFLDIDLKASMTGLELAKKIREINNTVCIIFATAHFEFIQKAFKVIMFEYLIKPITLPRLEECVIRYHQHISEKPKNHIAIKSGASTYFIDRHQIIYIEKNKSKTCIYTKKEMIETSQSLEELSNILPQNFKRIHKSCIVNTDKISKITSVKNEVLLDGGFLCFMGRKYKKDFMEGLNYE